MKTAHPHALLSAARAVFILKTAVFLTAAAACGTPRMEVSPAVPPCKAPSKVSVTWIAPAESVGRRLHAGWCETVGPPATHHRTAAVHEGRLIVVTWNVHGGAGDVSRLVRTLREQERIQGRGEPNLLLLVQEAVRSGPAVPATVPSGSPVPRAIRKGDPSRRDIVETARAEDLNAIYLPSMRNGWPGTNGRTGVPEDRGNAILSTLPLSEVVAIELPFHAQRRVAVAARIGRSGAPFTAAAVHLDTSAGQGRQAVAVLEALGAAAVAPPLLIAGDFNSAMRRRAAIRSGVLTVERVACRGGPTHKIFQIDHVLTAGLGDLRGCEQLGKFGSDHAALKLELPPAR